MEGSGMEGNGMEGLTRRRFMGAAAGGALGLGLPTRMQKLLAKTPERTCSISEVKHIVFVMQENRSFDHYFGSLSGVRGFDDPTAIGLSTGRRVFYQPDALNPDGYELPFRLDTTRTSAAAVADTGHGWPVQHQSWNGGKMDNWLPAHRASDGAAGPLVMGYYTRRDIPFHYALADAFTVCDNYHCSVIGPSQPNHVYAVSGTIDPAGLGGARLSATPNPTGCSRSRPTTSGCRPPASPGGTTSPENLAVSCRLRSPSSPTQPPARRCMKTACGSGRCRR
jgi:phospholipase C